MGIPRRPNEAGSHTQTQTRARGLLSRRSSSSSSTFSSPAPAPAPIATAKPTTATMHSHRKKSFTSSDHEGDAGGDDGGHSSFGRKSRSLFRLGFGRSNKDKAASRSPSPYGGRRSSSKSSVTGGSSRARSPSTERERAGASDYMTTDDSEGEDDHGHRLRAS